MAVRSRGNAEIRWDPENLHDGRNTPYFANQLKAAGFDPILKPDPEIKSIELRVGDEVVSGETAVVKRIFELMRDAE